MGKTAGAFTFNIRGNGSTTFETIRNTEQQLHLLLLVNNQVVI